MWPLPFCCSNGSQKCELENNNQGKKLDISIWKHDIVSWTFLQP